MDIMKRMMESRIMVLTEKHKNIRKEGESDDKPRETS
jgi:hypothetical protein